MSYVLIGETCADDVPLYVLWTRGPSGIRVLPAGSHARRDMQVIGRRIMEDSGRDVVVSLETIASAIADQCDGRPLRLIELTERERSVIERSIARELEPG